MRGHVILGLWLACGSAATASSVASWTTSTLDTTIKAVNTTSGAKQAIVGTAAGVGSIGVTGVSTGNGGTGVEGRSPGYGILGTSSGNGYAGVMGTTSEASGIGVFGYGPTGVSATSCTGDGYRTTAVDAYANGSDNAYAFGLNSNAYYAAYSYGIYSYASGASESWSGFFDGDVYAGTLYNASDLLFKKNVQPLTGGLGKIMALKPKTFEMKAEEFKDKVALPKGPQYGLIAQDLQGVLPDLVHSVTAPPRLTPEERKKGVKKDAVTFKAVNYQALIPILIEAVQEQQKQLKEQEDLIAAQRAALQDLQARVLKVETNRIGK